MQLCTQTNHILFDGCSAFGIAIVYFLQGHADKAHAALASALRIARTIESEILEHMCRMVEADFAFCEGRQAAGLTALREGLALGREQRFNNFIFWIPSRMDRLCLHALENDIEADYVAFIIRSRNLKSPCDNAIVWPWVVRIVTLDHFGIEVNGQPLEFGRKEPKKLTALLKAIIAFGGKNVSQARLIDRLWGEQDGDEAQMAFDKAIQRLRKLLGENTLLARGGTISLNSALVMVDALVVQRLLASTAEPIDFNQIDKILMLYQRPFIDDEDEFDWIISMRNNLHKSFLRKLKQSARAAASCGDYEKSLRYFQCCLQWLPEEEDLYQGTLFCQIKMARFADADTTFLQLSDLFNRVARQTLSPLTLELHAALVAQSPSVLPVMRFN